MTFLILQPVVTCQAQTMVEWFCPAPVTWPYTAVTMALTWWVTQLEPVSAITGLEQDPPAGLSV